MPFRLHLDTHKCQGYANCVIEAPELWDFDEDRDTALLIADAPLDNQRGIAEASVRCCPAQAISIEELSS